MKGSTEVKEGVKRTEEKSEALSEEQRAEKIGTDEEKSTTTPPEDDASKKIIEEACDESRGNEETIECGEEIDENSLYPNLEVVHAPEEKVKEFTFLVEEEESKPAEEPPPVIYQYERCSYKEEEPEWREDERTRRKAARAMNWVQQQPWPELRKMAKPPRSGVRPRENMKVLGMYRHHRKRWGIKLKAIPRKLRGQQ